MNVRGFDKIHYVKLVSLKLVVYKFLVVIDIKLQPKRPKYLCLIIMKEIRKV